MMRRIATAALAALYALLLGLFILSMGAYYANETQRPAYSDPCEGDSPMYGTDC